VPLLNDFANLRDALPDVPVPEASSYPGGAARARWHMQHGLRYSSVTSDASLQAYGCQKAG